jgi:hypothetical protein
MRVSRKRTGSGLVLALILGLSGLLAGCGTSGIRVQREAHFPSDGAGANFVMLAARGQDNDPAYARNAELVAAELTARHFVRVTEPASARFAVMVWEGRREPRAANDRPSEPPATGSRVRRGGMGMSDGSRARRNPTPSDAPGHDAPPERRVEIQIYDLTRPRGRSEQVFMADAQLMETQAGGRGTRELIAAALRDFPGHERERFSIPISR